MRSEDLFTRAKKLLPGGVSSPVRAISPYPFYTARAEGSRLYTVDGQELLDCCMAYGPLLMGHAHPRIAEAVRTQLENGWLYGTPVPAELELASLLTADHGGMEMVRFVSTGAEATMAALRLARGYTGKMDIVKIEGGFHGAHDAVLVKAGSGATTLGIPDSAGVVPDLVAHTHQVPFNDPEALEALLQKQKDVSAFILEPVMGNIGPVLPDQGYLKEVREITRSNDVLLIFDEVITGYRLGIGGAQRKYRVTPDLTTFGKIIGGGLPIGALAGPQRIMQLIAPAGPVYQAGTFNGNPLSLAAGIATIRYLHQHTDIYRKLDDATAAIEDALGSSGPGSFVRLGSMFKYYFRSDLPTNYAEAKQSDTGRFRKFWEKMKEKGIFIPPSQYETNFLSTAHTREDIEYLGKAYRTCISG
ncbi:MAG: glutamate-1-semialdehyde 2,1-aminomutase [Methanomicrobiales archaeon]|nr:glutamate-1-semialdehyde 2,1-aminomutase [Methanomicrobiales archaeon]